MALHSGRQHPPNGINYIYKVVMFIDVILVQHSLSVGKRSFLDDYTDLWTVRLIHNPRDVNCPEKAQPAERIHVLIDEGFLSDPEIQLTSQLKPQQELPWSIQGSSIQTSVQVSGFAFAVISPQQ
ncbi:hypothetical protein STEG23_025398, partial [Scotinomys teguina]